MSNNKDIIVVGSVAFDNIETIKGKHTRLLGGSGTYFSIAASLFSKVYLVGVVGDDFNESYIKMFNSKSISTDYLNQAIGETFHWGGIYSDDFSTRKTLFTKLGVFENFNPKIDIVITLNNDYIKNNSQKFHSTETNLIKIFPNPFKEIVTIEVNISEPYTLKLYDVTGKLLRDYKNINNDKLVIERGSLSSGTYLLKIINNKGTRMKKLIIE